MGNEEVDKEEESVSQKIVLEKRLSYVEHLECPEGQRARAKRGLRGKSWTLAKQWRDLPRSKLCRLGGTSGCQCRNQKSGRRFAFRFTRLA